MTDPYECIKNNDLYLFNRYFEQVEDIDFRNKHGFALFHYAAQYNNVEVLKILKDQGCDVLALNNAGDNALIVSCSWKSHDVTRQLLDWNFPLNDTNEHGNAALHYCCFWRQMDMAKLLIQKGAYLNQQNKNNQVPGDLLSPEQKEQMIDYAKESGISQDTVQFKASVYGGKDMNVVGYVKLELVERDLKIGSICIGEGPYSKTVQGKWKNIPVAVRIMKHSDKLSKAQYKQFMQEAENIRVIEDCPPSILPIIGMAKAGDLHAIVSNLAPKRNLGDLLNDESVDLSDVYLYRISYSISKALTYLKNRTVPLKLFRLNHSCFLVDERLQIKLNLADCGFTYCTHFPMSKYPQYIAPEVLKNPMLGCDKSHVYSFGVLLNYMFSRKIPFKNKNAMVLGLEVLLKDIRPQIDSEKTPSHIQRLIKLMWDKNVDTRPQIEDAAKIFTKLLNIA